MEDYSKNWLGKGKSIGKFGDIKISVKTSKIVDNTNEKGYCNNIRIHKLKEPDENGNEFTVYYDDWKPNAEKKEETKEPNNVGDLTQKLQKELSNLEQDLPF